MCFDHVQMPCCSKLQEHGFLPGAIDLHAEGLASGMGASCQKARAAVVKPAGIAPAFPGTDNLSPCKVSAVLTACHLTLSKKAPCKCWWEASPADALTAEICGIPRGGM